MHPLQSFRSIGYHGFSSLLFCVWAVGFAGLAIRSRKERAAYGFSLGALASTIALLSAGALQAWAMAFEDVRDLSIPDIDPMVRIDALTATFAKSDPVAAAALALGVVAAIASTLAVVAEWRRWRSLRRVAAVVLMAIATALAVNVHHLAHRGVAIHRDNLAWYLSEERLDQANPYHCDDLEDGLRLAHDIEEVERAVPDARARAKQCIAERLACLDAGGECAKEKANRIEIWQQLHPGKHTTPLRHEVAESPLLIDPGQKQDVSQRLAHEQELSAASP